MKEEDTGVVPIVEDGRPIGVITDRDIVLRAVADGSQANKPVREIATSDLVFATPDMSTREATKIMSERQIRRLPVVEADRLLAILSLRHLPLKQRKPTPPR